MSILSEKANKIIAYVPGIQPNESGWIKLNTNENPYPPSPKVAESIKKADINRLRFYPDPDSKELCAAIAGVLKTKIENVFIGNSSDEVLALAFEAFLNGKENVLMPDISYGYYPVWAQMYDVMIKQIPLKEDYTISIDEYKNAKGVVLANPNAPTGITLTLKEIESLILNNPDGVIIIDEAYIDFSEIESAVSLVGKYSNLLVVRTFSKAHSLAGLRVGFAVGQNELIDGLYRVKNTFNSYPLDMLAQIGAKAAILDTEYWNHTRRQIIKVREDTIKDLRELGFNVLPSHANFILMETGDALGLYEYLLTQKILVRYWNVPRLTCFLRITIGTQKEMEVLLSCVKQWLNEKQKKQQFRLK